MRPNEHPTTVILADLGCLRALRLHPPGTKFEKHEGPCKLEEISCQKMPRNTDRPNGFPTGHSVQESHSMSPGEAHEEKNEFIKRRLDELATLIENVLDAEQDNPWIFAAPKAIHRRLLDQIHPERRAALKDALQLDLTHATLRDLEERFLKKKALQSE